MSDTAPQMAVEASAAPAPRSKSKEPTNLVFWLALSWLILVVIVVVLVIRELPPAAEGRRDGRHGQR